MERIWLEMWVSINMRTSRAHEICLRALGKNQKEDSQICLLKEYSGNRKKDGLKENHPRAEGNCPGQRSSEK